MSTDLQALACADCPASVHTQAGTSPTTGGPVLVVTVEHSSSCPWLAAVGGPATLAPTPDRLLCHVTA